MIYFNLNQRSSEKVHIPTTPEIRHKDRYNNRVIQPMRCPPASTKSEVSSRPTVPERQHIRSRKASQFLKRQKTEICTTEI